MGREPARLFLRGEYSFVDEPERRCIAHYLSLRAHRLFVAMGYDEPDAVGGPADIAGDKMRDLLIEHFRPLRNVVTIGPVDCLDAGRRLLKEREYARKNGLPVPWTVSLDVPLGAVPPADEMALVELVALCDMDAGSSHHYRRYLDPLPPFIGSL